MWSMSRRPNDTSDHPHGAVLVRVVVEGARHRSSPTEEREKKEREKRKHSFNSEDTIPNPLVTAPKISPYLAQREKRKKAPAFFPRPQPRRLAASGPAKGGKERGKGEKGPDLDRVSRTMPSSCLFSIASVPPAFGTKEKRGAP